MASPGDPPHKGTRLVQIHDKTAIGTRFTWSEREGFKPKQEYLDNVAAKTSDPRWQADKPNLTLEWDASLLTFVYKDIV